MKYTFDALRHSSELQLNSVKNGTPPDVQMGVDAIVVSATLFDWIAVNVTDETRRADVARRITIALDMEPK